MKKDVVEVDTLIDGKRVETVAEAEVRAVDQAVAEVEDPTPADAQSAENIHDTLSRLGALSDAGKLGKIS